ncbi:MAG TPA: LuxR C-terminal-related transcriptional regulator [Miltoncostaeaceae bacterium]|nr:LuxR C-terminal-related transcriptional regulator [Miltoncostaeaceae bacterium]
MSPAAAAPPMLETKLRPPGRRAGLVPRPDLLARLDAGRDRRLTLVTAPAGWGKTTLVGDWLAGRASEGAGWVALDAADNDPARFWRYVGEALRRAGAPVDEQAVGALSGGGETTEAGLSTLINALATAPRRTLLALDDYHLIDDDSIHGAMSFLCANAPEGLRVVMTSRVEPPIGLARLRARGDLAELRADDLRFTELEAGALLADTGLRLGPDEVARLRARTEGWAAGLYLAGLSLRGRDDASRFIADFAGDDRLVVDYLADEVLEGLPAGRREFLLRTSILGRLTGPLCDAVADTTGSARVLAELESSNLFLVPLDNRREWYRYHHLFGELLQHELALTSPHEMPELHRRAAAWHLAQGSVDDAIGHAAAAGDLAQAADLIAESWSEHLRRGWTATTQRWLDLLPPETVRGDVRLCLAEAWLAVNLGLPGEADRWLLAADEAAGPGDGPEVGASRIAARSLERLLAGDAPEALRLGHEALAATEGDETWLRAGACLAAGIALHAVDRLAEATPILEECAEVGRRTGAWAPALVALCHLADQEVERGDLESAERRAREALAYAEEESHAEYPHAAGAHTGLAQVVAARGDLDAAQAHADRGAELASRGRAPTEIAYSVIVRGQVALMRGDDGLARACARDARDLLESAPSPGGHLAQKLRVLDDALRAAPRPAEPAAVADLTERELAVLRMLTGLASAREIADQLYVSHNTVKTQIRSIYRKLGVATRAEAVARGRELGLLAGSLAER